MSQNKTPHTVICRPFMRDEWQALRASRLEALQDAPGAFTSSHARESKRSERFWRNTAQSQDCTVFGLFVDEKPVGILGIATMSGDATGRTAVLWGTYIRKSWRGKGLTKALYKTALAYAAQRGDWQRVVISHRESNEASKRATLAHGFRHTLSEEKKWPDGTTENELFYELEL